MSFKWPFYNVKAIAIYGISCVNQTIQNFNNFNKIRYRLVSVNISL